jgi:diacylglycerol O-acyltransferase
MSGRRPIDPVDLLLLKQEAEPRRRATITLVLMLASAPPYAQVVELMRRTAQSEPRLRQRLVHPWARLGPPEWTIDPDFDIHRHVRRDTLAESATQRQLLDLVERSAGAELDPHRPLWRAVLLEGGGPDAVCAAAFVARMSHVLADGLVGMQLLAGVVEASSAATAQPEPVVVGESEPAAGDEPEPGAGLSRRRLTAERVLLAPARMQIRAWRTSVDAVRSSASLLDDPRGQVNRAARYARSLARVAAPASARPSPALRARGNRRRVALVEVPVRELRRAAKAAGGSLHDGYLAAVIGGLRHYHEALGTPVDEVPFAIPISTRARGRAPDAADQSAGNRFAGVRFSAPTGIADPAERIRLLAATVQSARAEPALDSMTTFAPALAQLPTWMLGLAGRVQDRLDMQASYVPGPPVPVRLAGAQVTSMIAFGPLPGPAAMSLMLTYAGIARIGFTLDAAAVTDVAVFERAMQAGFAEVLALAARPAE